jgi:formylglycine-generating enzyme required for sulfatase activity
MSSFGPVPVASHLPNARGLYDMFGNVWEWTSTPFLPYPGFKAFPYDGYSKDHMKGEHRVCRGGSWATSRRILRSTFRNWYVPTYRQGFLGLRLAR